LIGKVLNRVIEETFLRYLKDKEKVFSRGDVLNGMWAPALAKFLNLAVRA